MPNDKVVPATAAHAREQADVAARALMLAEEHRLEEGVEWDRRGVLGRLVRKDV